MDQVFAFVCLPLTLVLFAVDQRGYVFKVDSFLSVLEEDVLASEVLVVRIQAHLIPVLDARSGQIFQIAVFGQRGVEYRPLYVEVERHLGLSILIIVRVGVAIVVIIISPQGFALIGVLVERSVSA